MNEKKEPFHIDSAMLELFRKELASEAAKIEEALIMLKAGGTSPDIYDHIWHGARQIKSAAHIMHFGSLIHLTDALEELSLQLRKLTQQEQKKFFPLIDQAIAFLKSKAGLKEAELLQQVQKGDETADKIARAMAAASNVQASKEHAGEVEQVAENEALIDPALVALFKAELENQCGILSNALLEIEKKGAAEETFDTMLRAVHSIKGAARVVSLGQVTSLAHIVEDVLVAAKKHAVPLNEEAINTLFAAFDFLLNLSRQPQTTIQIWLSQQASHLDTLKKKIGSISSTVPTPTEEPAPPPQAKEKGTQPEMPAETKSTPTPAEATNHGQDRTLHVTAESLNRLMGLAGESLVESRWLQPFSESLSRIKKTVGEITQEVEAIESSTEKGEPLDQIALSLKQLGKRTEDCQKNLSYKISDLELYINRHSNVSDRLYREVIDSRMRAFGDGVKGFPRMVRDLAHQLGKKVNFEIVGKSTPVDRDILDMLETPLAHLLRNAVDHGIEMPEVRISHGKPPVGTLTLEAEHRAGMLSITVSDDGKGIDTEEIRNIVLERGLVSAQIASKLTDNELIDFLFLPGFSSLKEASDISGRGIGLNAVQTMVHSVSGAVHCSFVKGKGVRINLELPLTLSVIRALLVEVDSEPYAFPLNRLDRTVSLLEKNVEVIENRQYFHFEGKNVGLISCAQILGLEEKKLIGPQLSVVLVNDKSNQYGIVVDSFLGERELVLHQVDPRLGKVPDISSGAFMEDGSPVLIFDVEDLMRTIDNILFTGTVSKLSYGAAKEAVKKTKRVLVIDDSITVREVECRLLRNKGYQVDTAINGMEGWNALRMGEYDLVITDVDMPRMNGIELVRAIKADSRLKSMPVMIVSYKERENDRIQGLEAGANYYLTKSSFHDQALLDAVVDLIGEP